MTDECNEEKNPFNPGFEKLLHEALLVLRGHATVESHWLRIL
jgi:hypothetical protein